MPTLRAAKSASTTAAEGLRPLDSIGCICKFEEEDIAAELLLRLFNSGEDSYTVSRPGVLAEASLSNILRLSMTVPMLRCQTADYKI